MRSQSQATRSTAVDALFKLPLDEFTSARNALAAQLKKVGRLAEANEVKALAKPSVSAWVVNQLYWQHRGSFDRLVEAGERLRRAQAARATAESLREPVNARREAVAELAEIAADMLREANYGATRDMLRRVTSTLDSVSSYGTLLGAPSAGRLTDDVGPLGFDAATGLLPTEERRGDGEARRPRPTTSAPKRPRRAGPIAAEARREQKQRKSLAAAAKTAVRDAERALSAARKQAERAAARLESAEARAKELESQRAELERRLARASREAEAAHERAREAAAAASEATRLAEDAERAFEQARRRRDDRKSQY